MQAHPSPNFSVTDATGAKFIFFAAASDLRLMKPATEDWLLPASLALVPSWCPPLLLRHLPLALGLGEVLAECVESDAADVMLDAFRIGFGGLCIDAEGEQEIPHDAVARA